MKQISQLQELRGIAIIMVVIFHATIDFTEAFLSFKYGVLLFFTISGYIVCLVHSNDQGIDRAIQFIKKRIARVHFPYIPILVLFIVLIFFLVRVVIIIMIL